jgi:hypothetical protein
MKRNEACGCLTRQIFVKSDSYWCLVDDPVECPYSLHFDKTYTCIHPERHKFVRKCAGTGSESFAAVLKH